MYAQRESKKLEFKGIYHGFQLRIGLKQVNFTFSRERVVILFGSVDRLVTIF